MPAEPYRPRPFDTSGVELPAAVAEVAESLARNVHETWAAGRIGDGWRYGAERDERRKLHPSLVPYEDLPEGEKKYDRATVTETLKVLCALGFRILEPERKGGAP